MILNNRFHCCLIIISTILLFCNTSIVIFPFKSIPSPYLIDYKKDKNKNTSNSSEFFDNNYIFKLLTVLKLGTPPQDIISPIELYSDYFSIKNIQEKELYKDIINNKGYKYEESLSFQNISNYSIQDYIGEDDLYLYTNINDIKLNKFLCLHNIKFDINILNIKKSNNKNNKYYTLSIGMNLNDENLSNFMGQIYNRNYINSFIFSFIYNDEKNDNNDIIKGYDGMIVIGNYPHKILPEKYKDTNYVSFYSNQPKIMFLTNFYLSFDEIIMSYNDNKIINKKDRAILCLNSGLILGTEEYRDFVEQNFFEKYYKLNICDKYITKTDSIEDFIIISCNYNIHDILKSEGFPILYFHMKSKNIIFEFSYQDLFKKVKNKYYFLIAFETKNKGIWRLGKPFLSKYSFVYNGEAKTIGFYQHIKNDSNTDDNIKNNNDNGLLKLGFKNIFIFIILLIIFIALIAFISFRYGKKINFVRKKLANELNDDDFEYNPNLNKYKDINEYNYNENEKHLELIEKRKGII